MVLAAAWIALGTGLLYAGAEALVRGAAAIAQRAGLSRLVIGLTVVAFGTSMPELVVSVGATLSGEGPIAVGNVVGSNVANVALILALTALIAPPAVHWQVIRFDLPVLVVTSVLLVAFLADAAIGRIEGTVLLAGLVAYVVASFRTARREAPTIEAGLELPPADPAAPLGRQALLVVGGLALLALGGRLLVQGAVVIATVAGVSEAVIGLTIVAVGTSLPELATSVVAALKGESDLAVGNVVGSNIFNILGILGVASLARPIGDAGMSAVDLGVMTGLAVALLPLMRTGFRVSRAEGAVLLLGYALYVGHLLGRGG